jgi:hypothetical protein
MHYFVDLIVDWISFYSSLYEFESYVVSHMVYLYSFFYYEIVTPLCLVLLHFIHHFKQLLAKGANPCDPPRMHTRIPLVKPLYVSP